MTQYFVMLETANPGRMIPLKDIRGDVLLFASRGQAEESTKENIMAQAYGYGIYERL